MAIDILFQQKYFVNCINTIWISRTKAAMNPVLGFLRRNLVFVVTIPSIIGLHYGWYRLQFNETFVPKEEKVKVLGIDIKGLEKTQSSTSS